MRQRGRNIIERPTQKQRERERQPVQATQSPTKIAQRPEGLRHPRRGCWSDAEGLRGCAMPQRAYAKGFEANAEAKRADATLQWFWRWFRGANSLNIRFRIERYYCRIFFLSNEPVWHPVVLEDILHNNITLILVALVFPHWIFPMTTCPKIMVSLVCFIILSVVDL